MKSILYITTFLLVSCAGTADSVVEEQDSLSSPPQNVVEITSEDSNNTLDSNTQNGDRTPLK